MAFEGYTFYFQWEVVFMEWLQNTLPTFLITLISWCSAFGEELVLIGLTGYLYWCRNKKEGIAIGTSLATGIVVNPMVKNIFFRRRPYFDNPGIKCLRLVESGADPLDIAAQGYSFPSGHSTNSVAAYGAVAKTYKKKWLRVLAFVLPFLVGFSRMVVGCHYPTDVLCGWLLGLLVMLFVSFLFSKFEDIRIITAILGVIGLVGVFYCQTDDFFTGYGIMMGVLLSVPFERKYVNFKETNNVLECIIRVVLGGLIFLALNKILKLPFNPEFLESGVFAAKLVRLFRYMIVAFVDLGVYPLLFRVFKFKQRG